MNHLKICSLCTSTLQFVASGHSKLHCLVWRFTDSVVCLSGKITVLQLRWVRSVGGMLPVGDIRNVGKPKF